MGLFDFIGGIFAPASKLVDDLHTSDEEKLTLKNELANIQAKACLLYTSPSPRDRG